MKRVMILLILLAGAAYGGVTYDFNGTWAETFANPANPGQAGGMLLAGGEFDAFPGSSSWSITGAIHQGALEIGPGLYETLYDDAGDWFSNIAIDLPAEGYVQFSDFSIKVVSDIMAKTFTITGSVIDDTNTWKMNIVGSGSVTEYFGYSQGGILSGTMELCPAVPAPSALLLASMGAGLVGWIRRNRSL